jgi:hypothetical protein
MTSKKLPTMFFGISTLQTIKFSRETKMIMKCPRDYTWPRTKTLRVHKCVTEALEMLLLHVFEKAEHHLFDEETRAMFQRIAKEVLTC